MSAAVRVIAFLIPVSAAVAASVAASNLLPVPTTAMAVVGWWLSLLVVSSVTLLVVERLARRLLPLAVLLRLTLLFPDRAPSRIMVAWQAHSVHRLQDQLERARDDGVDDDPTRAAERILALVAALGMHDRRTRGHSERVRVFTDLLAEELRLPEADKDRIRWAALLHDVGKLGVPPRILNKSGELVRREWDVVHRHPDEGARLAGSLLPWLGPWGHAISQHHERFDGEGYPRGLAGTSISYGARIVAVADSYETMTGARAYKRARTAISARHELTRYAGTQFDPAVVRAFLNISIRHLWWATGPLAWLFQVPFVRSVPEMASRAATAGSHAGAAAGTAVAVTGLAMTGVVARPGPPARPLSAQTVRRVDAAPPAIAKAEDPAPRPAPAPVAGPSEAGHDPAAGDLFPADPPPTELRPDPPPAEAVSVAPPPPPTSASDKDKGREREKGSGGKDH